MHGYGIAQRLKDVSEDVLQLQRDLRGTRVPSRHEAAGVEVLQSHHRFFLLIR